MVFLYKKPLYSEFDSSSLNAMTQKLTYRAPGFKTYRIPFANTKWDRKSEWARGFLQQKLRISPKDITLEKIHKNKSFS
jgi:hypothetical protein